MDLLAFRFFSFFLILGFQKRTADLLKVKVILCFIVGFEH